MSEDLAGTVGRTVLWPAASSAVWAATRPLLPGLGAVAAASAVAFTVAALVPGLGATTVAVVLGALGANLGLHRAALRPGTSFAATRLLRVGVVLLGLQLSLSQLVGLGWGGVAVVAGTVALTFAGTQVLGRLLRVERTRALLVATGFSICGASAVGAMKEVVDSDEQDVGVAVALVTLCGSLAILALPPLRGVLGLDVTSFGAWVGASVHDVGQTVATANRVPGALSTAVVVKLSRVVLLAPIVAAVAWHERRRAVGLAVGAAAPGTDGGAAPDAAAPVAGGRRPVPVPLFVLGFLAAIALASTGWVPGTALALAEGVQQVMLVAALVGLGAGIHLAVLRRTGGRALVLGLASWLLVAVVAYAGVRLVGV